MPHPFFPGMVLDFRDSSLASSFQTVLHVLSPFLWQQCSPRAAKASGRILRLWATCFDWTTASSYMEDLSKILRKRLVFGTSFTKRSIAFPVNAQSLNSLHLTSTEVFSHERKIFLPIDLNTLLLINTYLSSPSIRHIPEAAS